MQLAGGSPAAGAEVMAGPPLVAVVELAALVPPLPVAAAAEELAPPLELVVPVALSFSSPLPQPQPANTPLTILANSSASVTFKGASSPSS
jgi:hypothetical protein